MIQSESFPLGSVADRLGLRGFPATRIGGAIAGESFANMRPCMQC